MTVMTPDSGLESLERRYQRLLRLLPYPLLVVPFIPYVLSQSPSPGALGITAAIAVAAAAWTAWMNTLHPRWAERPREHRAAGPAAYPGPGGGRG